ncbi:WhiB family transcriptional regulator [Dermatophilaceae bacterium Soc4.6]
MTTTTIGSTGSPQDFSGPRPGLQADWAPLGNCVKSDPDALFVRGAAQQQAKLICQRCPVVAECLADALDNTTEFGVWGGMTERERRAMLRRHPRVASWWILFNEHRQQGTAAPSGARTF